VSREEKRGPEEDRTSDDRTPAADDRKQREHSRLSDREDAEQRGEDAPDSVGAPRPKVDDQEDPGWEPDPHAADRWKDYIAEVGREHRPHREDVLPYLLIRAFAPGDRAARPIWPPQPSWLSPDIHLIDDTWTGPFRPEKVVGSPTAGRSYRVFVHVWNLGLLQAVGVHLRAWYVAPGFFGGQPGTYTPELIGGAFFDLQPRTAPGAHRVAEVIPAWSIPPNLTGHECLLASVECPADRWDGALDANADRHVGQRNLTILGPAASLAPLLQQLGESLREGELLEMTLGADEVKGAIRYGVPIAGGQHLFVAGKRDERLLILPTTRLANLLGERFPDLSEPGVAAALFNEVWEQFEAELWADGLDRALGNLLDTDELMTKNVLRALGGEGARTLQLAAFDGRRNAVGGYSVRLEPNPQG
jgi:hypothetical protein